MTPSEEAGGADAVLAAVVAWINHEQGTSYALRGRFPVGTAGARRVEDAAGA